MTIPAPQREVAALLHGLAARDPIETHISAVYVGPDTVWKLRKAVRLEFLDFSTCAERRRTALREVELNAPHAPGLYRDVVAVTRTAEGGLMLGGEGETVDWVLRMAPVPAADFLGSWPEAALHGLADPLGDAVAAFHATLTAAVADAPDQAMLACLAGNAATARRVGLAEAEVAAWEAAMTSALRARAGWLRRRAAEGFVRRAHGDLHLGNVALWRGRPVAFDALEFDEALATIDLGYDLAFLLMDLDIHAGRSTANRVLNRYVARSGDAGLATGLPPFLSMRALIRAHVAAARGRLEEARDYLGRAHGYLSPAPPRLVAVGGLPGSGKSTLARALAPMLGAAPGALVLRSDEIRKRQHGVAPEVRLPASAYGAKANRAVAAALIAAAAEALAAGQAVIADATFLGAAQRAAIAEAAGAAPFLGVWLDAPLSVLEARIAGRRHDASDADIDVLRRMAHAPGGGAEWLAVPNGTPEAVLATVRTALAS